MFANNSGENVKKTTGSILSSNSTPGHISRKDENSNLKKKNTYTPVFIAVPFTICSMWKQPKCL